MNSVDPMPHAEAAELLPWLANGGLEGTERERVDAHAQDCVICRRDLEELTRLETAIREEATTAPAPRPDMRRINARIDAELDRERRGARLAEAVRAFARSPLRLTVAVQSVAIAALLAVLVWPEPERAGFTTLTTPTTLPAGNYVRVVFDPGLDAAGIDAIAEDFGLALVTGPTDRGVATLRITALAADSSPDVMLTGLREQPGVLFAEPVMQGSR